MIKIMWKEDYDNLAYSKIRYEYLYNDRNKLISSLKTDKRTLEKKLERRNIVIRQLTRRLER